MFKSIKDILPQTIKKAGLEDKVQESLVLNKFSQIIKEILNPEIENKLRPLYLRHGFLVLACLDDELIEKIKKAERDIIYRINQGFQKQIIKGLKFLD